jgi:hypothetical protein
MLLHTGTMFLLLPDNGPGIVLSVIKIGEDQADRPDIHMAQGVLVVFVNQNHHFFPMLIMQFDDQFAESQTRQLAFDPDSIMIRDFIHQRNDDGFQIGGIVDNTGSEAEADDGITHIPIPAIFEIQSAEILIFPGKRLLQGVNEQAFAESTGAGQKNTGPDPRAF